jgi:hypothetical protein
MLLEPSYVKKADLSKWVREDDLNKGRLVVKPTLKKRVVINDTSRQTPEAVQKRSHSPPPPNGNSLVESGPRSKELKCSTSSPSLLQSTAVVETCAEDDKLRDLINAAFDGAAA